MNKDYINIYNNLVNFSRNKKIFSIFTQKDTFSDRLIILLFHLGFFIKNYKSSVEKNEMQKIYDYIFRQLELSIREIGYGDQSINKKMKEYINVFHGMVSDIHFWETLSKIEKLNKISNFLVDIENTEYLVDYFEDFNQNLSKKTLNSYLKSVSNA